MQPTTETILHALSHIIYPELNKDLVTLNLIEDLAISENKVSFNFILTSPNNPFKKSLEKACIDTIHNFIDKSVEVKVNFVIHAKPAEIKKATKKLANIKNIIAISSGKGGVGKSTVASNLAVALAQMNYKVGLLDADIYGPSLPKMFHAENHPVQFEKIDDKDILVPIEKYGVKLLSIGFFIKAVDAMVWRGPMASSALKQLINDANWGDLDFMLIDLPPGTSDIHLTMVQEVAVTGAIIVSTPQEVALADVVKGISMFRVKNVNVPILGLVENMSWFTPAELPDNKYYIFGKDGCKRLSDEYKIPLLGQIPLVQSICESGDNGDPVALDKTTIVGAAFHDIAKKLIEQLESRNTTLPPTQKVQIKS